MFNRGPTVNAILDDLIRDYQVNKRKSLDSLRHHLKPLRVAIGTQAAHHVRSNTIKVYVLGRQYLGTTANATINRELSALKRAYALAEITTGPKITLLQERNVRQGVFTREEVERVCKELPTHLARLTQFAYLTGRRKGEITQIQWSDVDIENRVVRIQQSTTKNGQPDTIPLTPEVYASLYNCDRDFPVGWPYVFSYRGKPIGDFNRTWHRACAKAGVPGKLFHDLRRTVMTDLISAGVPLKVAMSVTGHKTDSTARRYHIVNLDQTIDAHKALAAYRAKPYEEKDDE